MLGKRALITSATLFATGFGLARHHINELEERAQGGPRQQLVVASRDLEAGAELTPEDFAARPVPEAYVSQRAVLATSFEELVGRRLTQALSADEPLLWTDVSRAGSPQERVAALIPAGHRAFVVRGRSGGASDLVEPGHRVDVLYVSGDASESGTLLQNVHVIAVDGQTAAGAANDGFRSTRAITLSVTVEQAQLLAQAEQTGDLRLSLRNPDDTVQLDGIATTRRGDLRRRLRIGAAANPTR